MKGSGRITVTLRGDQMRQGKRHSALFDQQEASRLAATQFSLMVPDDGQETTRLATNVAISARPSRPA